MFKIIKKFFKKLVDVVDTTFSYKIEQITKTPNTYGLFPNYKITITKTGKGWLYRTGDVWIGECYTWKREADGEIVDYWNHYGTLLQFRKIAIEFREYLDKKVKEVDPNKSFAYAWELGIKE